MPRENLFFIILIKIWPGSPIKLGMTSYYGSSIKDFEDDSGCAFEDDSGCAFEDDSGCAFEDDSGCDFEDDSGCDFEDDSGCAFGDDSYFEFLQTQEWRKET